MNWLIQLKFAEALQTAFQLSDEINNYANQISMAKGQFLQQQARAPQQQVGKTPITDTLNRCWQSVVSAARCLKSNDAFSAGDSIANAKEMMQSVCNSNDCSQQALSTIMNLLNKCEQSISGLVERMYSSQTA